jgi:hypothetical protein
MPRLFSAAVKTPRVLEEWRMKTRLDGSPCHKDCTIPVESAIVPWYWFDADIKTGAVDEDDRDLMKVCLS